MTSVFFDTQNEVVFYRSLAYYCLGKRILKFGVKAFLTEKSKMLLTVQPYQITQILLENNINATQFYVYSKWV
jgi:hypothetical protein